MVATATAYNYCDAVLKLDNASGVPKDISGQSNKVDMELSNMIGEFKPFGSKFYIRMACGKDATISVDGVCSTTADEALDLLQDWYQNAPETARTFTIDAPDSSPGGSRYTFEVLLESLSIPGTADEANPAVWSAELKPTGEFTIATIAS